MEHRGTGYPQSVHKQSSFFKRIPNNLIHKFFEPAKLNIEIKDRFGNPIVPREWFLVPRFVIDEAIEKIKEGTVVNYQYDAKKQRIIARVLSI